MRRRRRRRRIDAVLLVVMLPSLSVCSPFSLFLLSYLCTMQAELGVYFDFLFSLLELRGNTMDQRLDILDLLNELFGSSPDPVVLLFSNYDDDLQLSIGRSLKGLCAVMMVMMDLRRGKNNQRKKIMILNKALVLPFKFCLPFHWLCSSLNLIVLFFDCRYSLFLWS